MQRLVSVLAYILSEVGLILGNIIIRSPLRYVLLPFLLVPILMFALWAVHKGYKSEDFT